MNDSRTRSVQISKSVFLSANWSFSLTVELVSSIRSRVAFVPLVWYVVRRAELYVVRAWLNVVGEGSS